MERPHGAANLDVGVFLTDGTGYHLVPLFEHRRDDVLVAYTYIFKVEGSGVAGIGTHLGPLRGQRVAVGPLYEVEQFLNVGGHLVHRNTVLLPANALGVAG